MGTVNYAAVGVVQDDEMLPEADIAAPRPHDGTKQPHGPEHGWIDTAADVPDHHGFARFQVEDLAWINPGIDTTEDHRFPRRHNL